MDHIRIQQSSGNSQKLKLWRYVPTDLNPADAPSRGVVGDHSSPFIQGPRFLLDKKPHWLSSGNFVDKDTQEIDSELRKSFMVANVGGDVQVLSLGEELFTRVGSYHRVLRVLSLVMLFISKLKKDNSNENVTLQMINAEKGLSH